jgi:IS30 family transposase
LSIRQIAKEIGRHPSSVNEVLIAAGMRTYAQRSAA